MTSCLKKDTKQESKRTPKETKQELEKQEPGTKSLIHHRFRPVISERIFIQIGTNLV